MLRVIHGDQAAFPWFAGVLAGSQLDLERFKSLKADAEKEEDAAKRRRLMQVVNDLEAEFSDLERDFGTYGALAITKHDAQFFRDVAKVLEDFASGAGRVQNESRNRLSSCYFVLCFKLHRPPTERELFEEGFSGWDRAQFAKTCTALGLEFTSAKLLEAIRLRADRLRHRGKAVTVSMLRKELRPLKTAHELLSWNADLFKAFCESAGVRFS